MRKLKLLLAALALVGGGSSVFASKTVYLVPGVWAADGARYALYMFTGETAGPWAEFTDTDEDGIYSADFDEKYESMIFIRLKPGTAEEYNSENGGLNWNNKYNQTDNIAAPVADGIQYNITGWGEGDDAKSTYNISIHGATAASFTNGGKYLFKNVGSGKYLGPANDWGTQASLILGSMHNTVHYQQEGIYTIESQVSNGGTKYYFSGTYMDSDEAAWLNIRQIGEGVYVIAPSDNVMSFYGYDGSSTVLASGLADFNNANAQWQIVSTDDAITNATAENPVDVSFLISNPNFDRNHRSGTNVWTNPNSLGLAGGDKTNFCVEAYEKTFDLFQTITVPNGYYKVRAQAAVTMHNNRTVVAYDATACPVIYATSGPNTVTTPFKEMASTDQLTTQTQIGNAFLAGSYVTDYSDILTVSNKSIKIGAKSEYSNIWGVFDTFMLQYCGPLDLTQYVQGLTNAVSLANATNGTVPTACYNAIAAVVTQYNQEYDNSDDYETAIDAINTAVSTYASDNIVAAYTRYSNIKAAVLAINAEIDVTTADAAAEAATTNTAIDDAVPTLRNALTNYLADVVDQEIDVTAALIDNPAPGTSGNLDWWTTNQATGYGNNLYEFYSKDDASSRQTIKATMPVGYYKLTVVGYTREGYTARMFVDVDNTNLAYQQLVGVASSTVNNLTQGNSWIAEGNGTNEMRFNLSDAANSNLTIGIWGGDQGDKWTAWRSFKLEYLGTAPVSVFDELLTATIAACRTTVDGLAVPDGVKSAFNSLADGHVTAKASYTIAAQFSEAIDAIEAGVETAREAIAPTAENPKVLAKATAATTSLTGLADADKATLQEVIDSNTAALAACTTAAAVEDQNEALWTAIGTAINSIELTGDAKLDLTFLLTNPNVDDFYTGAYNVKVEGWYTEQEGGNFQVVPGEGCANADGVHKHAYEYWSENPRANDKFTLYQKVTLPVGTFAIECYAFADQAIGGDVHGIYFYANDTQGSCVTTNTLAEQGITFVNDEQQEVKIGLKAIVGNTYRWMGIGYMELYKVPAKSYTVDETLVWDNTTEGAGDVTLKRTIKEGVNTLVLPFSMTQAEVESTFGEGSKVYAVSAYDAASENISFATHNGISANQPCLLKATAAGTEYTLEGRTIVAGEPVASGTDVAMTGTYAASTEVPTGSYIISGGKIYNVNSSVTLKNTRAYITLTAAAEGARALTFSLDGETTGIATLQGGELKVETGSIYDLSGRKVNTMTKGVYVVNGKKVVK